MARAKFWIVFILVLCAFTGNIFRYSYRAPKRHYSDFRVYYATGERFLAKQDIYSRPDMSITPYKYSPMFAMLFSPLSMLEKYHASLIFFIINFLTLVGCCLVTKELLGAGDLSYKQKWILYFFSILFTSRFILHVWDAGQVNLLMMLLVLVGLLFFHKGKMFAGAGFLSLSIMFKYMPAVFIPYFILRGRWRYVFYMGVFGIIYCTLPAIYVGVEKQIAYMGNWMPFITKTSLDVSSMYDYKNQSLFSLILRLFTESQYGRSIASLTYSQGLMIGAAIGGLIYLLVLVKRGDTRHFINIDYAILLLCMAIFNPNAWLLNFVVFLFAYMFLLNYLMKNQWKDKITAILMVLAFAISSWASESLVGNNLQDFFEELSTVTIGALLLIFALLRLKYSSQTKVIENES